MFSMILVALALTAIIVVFLLLMIWAIILICKMIWEEVTEGKKHKEEKWTELSWKHMIEDYRKEGDAIGQNMGSTGER